MDSKSKTRWHLLLGRLLQIALEPLGVEVRVDFQLLSEPPRADILLLRLNDKENWTVEQRQWLADGLRHAKARHLLIEFKRSESLNFKAVRQLNAYDYFYCNNGKFKLQDVACFLVVATTPRAGWQEQLGFVATKWPGVYKGVEKWSVRMQVILLNELANTPYNAPLKLFATRRLQRKLATASIHESGLWNLSRVVEQFFTGLLQVIGMPRIAQTMEFTPDMVVNIGQQWIESILNTTPVSEYLKHHDASEVLSHYKPDEVLSHYKPDEVLSHYKPNEVLSHYKPDEVLSHYKPDERLQGLPTDEVLSHYNEEEILAYLTKLRQSKH